ncbi:biotin carboxylase N-terminal domain-containing protein [Fodinicola acaciae]|uniref:ATP-binding protein n=1 Tax=Fodinicola acaciae TaxID=2681555 RepID=UPI0013D86BC4|nr:biotin carboxylase N-terminal domain-containing protein [Fodinicola acaciae]
MIQKILVANRGEIAARVMRTAAGLGIRTVAVFSDPDAEAPFVAQANESVRLPGASPRETYLDADKVIAAALATGADAIHPGYGFLSENAGFARKCEQAGLTFIGPPASAIDAMGSKLTAKKLMADAGVPVLPSAEVDGDTDLAAVAAKIGFPVLVKAAFGGGGRGMRIVREEAGLADAVERATSEAASAFGDGTVFIERYLDAPRHIEVQIFGDTSGNVVSLFERECSIQRRYQKIIEESPSPAVDDKLRAQLGEAAVAAGKAIGYVGAGTVEFVMDQAGEFFFLEVNTRLQVEHPVTELVTGLDLVALQIRVAEGAPLPAEVTDATITGSAIEARLYAEDVPAGFLPSTGTLHVFEVPDGPGVRVDSGVRTGSVVSVHYDPMLAKVIAYGRDRAEAARRLATALADARVHGVTTNRDLLVAILRDDEFLAGRIDTGYLTRHDPAQLGAQPGGLDILRTHTVAAALAAEAGRRGRATVLPAVPSGWRNVPTQSQLVGYRLGVTVVEVGYRFGRDRLHVTVDGEPVDVRLHAASATTVDLELSGVRRLVTIRQVDGTSYVDSVLGSTALVETPRFPDPEAAEHTGSLRAPMPGSVLRVLVATGSAVRKGQPLLVLEAMKMEHTVAAPADGVLTEMSVSTGQQVDTGQVLAVVGDTD